MTAPTEDPNAAAVEDPEAPPAAPETPPSGEATPAATPAEEPEPTLEELKQQVVEKDAEIAKLKEGKEEPAEEEAEPAPTEEKPPAAGESWSSQFLSTSVPAAKKQFTAEDATPEKQFDVLLDVTDRLVGAVLHDQIRPTVHKLSTALIVSSNEIDLLHLKLDDPAFKAMEPQVRKALAKLPLADRAKPEAVRDVYYRLRGSKANGQPASPTPRASPSGVLRDVAAGGGAPRKPASVRLTAEQEAERRAIEAEQDTPLPPEKYAAQVKVRQDRAKANNRPIPQLLRDQV